ncbi:tyrosine-type recombinase/integrase [Microvirga sp. KLBC 81]|uniref:tyrosine-type recombinase/integrase n=1 Tax=Microvirga sp. KLBC 81 TaxID=1862707 RepID=UPI00352C2B12
MHGEFGSPEFIANFFAATKAGRGSASDTLLRILRSYQQSEAFLDLSENTQRGYAYNIRKIEKEFGDLPLAALKDKRTRGEFKRWRTQLARSSRRQADYVWSVFGRILSWAMDMGEVDANPCSKGGRLYKGSRKDKVWTLDHEKAFLDVASAPLRLAFVLALWTGQRQGDLLKLPWSAYNGTHIRLKQSKTGAKVVIPVGLPLKRILDSTPRRSERILVNLDGVPWTPNGFRSSWRKACIKAGIKFGENGLTFNDLRGTAVTRLAVAGCTEAEIATITGHSLRDVRSILDEHYLSRDPELAETAIRKLEDSHNVRETKRATKKKRKIPD